MARIMIVSLGTRGDVQPYIALGIGLQQAGHTVKLVTHENFRDMIGSYGLGYAPINTDAHALLSGEGGLRTMDVATNPIKLLGRLTEIALPTMRQSIADIAAGLCETDLVLGSSLGYMAAYPQAKRLGVPIYPAYVQPASPSAVYPNVAFPPLFGRTPIAPIYNRLSHALFAFVFKQIARRVKHEIPQDVDLDHLFGLTAAPDQPYLYGFSPVLVPKPRAYTPAMHLTGYWFLDQQRNWQPPADLQNFIDAGSPPVYIGFGSMSSRNPQELAGIAIGALRQTGRRGILMTGWGGLDPQDLPPEIRVVRSVPHDWLFPRMAAIVHHGGSGTTGEALRAGQPQIVIPFGFDQPFWANRLKAIGVGQAINRTRLTADQLAHAIDHAVTDQRMQAQAAAIGIKVRAENGVANAVAAINSLI